MNYFGKSHFPARWHKNSPPTHTFVSNRLHINKHRCANQSRAYCPRISSGQWDTVDTVGLFIHAFFHPAVWYTILGLANGERKIMPALSMAHPSNGFCCCRKRIDGLANGLVIYKPKSRLPKHTNSGREEIKDGLIESVDKIAIVEASQRLNVDARWP